MGNFTSTGKEIDYEDEILLLIFENIQEPIDKDELINKVHDSSKILKDDINEVIDYLINENFIVNYEEYESVINNNKYNRQDLFFSMFTEKNNKISEKLKGKNVLILGLGGIGANTCLMLYKAGFNTFTIVDYDRVEESNLTRQFPYNKNDIGKYKIDCIKEKIPGSKITAKNIRISDEKDISELIKSADFVLCTVDKPSRIVRRIINKVCVKYKKPVLFCGFAEHVGMIGPFIVPGKTACLQCIEKKLKEVPLNNVSLVPSYGPLCFMISSIVTNEIINYYIKYNKNNLIGKTLMFDFATYKSKIINWKRKDNCKECEKCK